MTGQPEGLSGRSVAVLMTGCNAHRCGYGDADRDDGD
jgi:hypothetical protein